MKSRLLLLITLFQFSFLFGQEYPFPVATEVNQANLKIEKIVVSENRTDVYLFVVNHLDSGGWYCADKDIYLESEDSKARVKLFESKGIPTCPERHYFKAKGEKLSFVLSFPSIKAWGGRINLVENCDNSCFYFKGIILDNKLSSDIHLFDMALDQFEQKDYAQAYNNFKILVGDIPPNPTHVYGFAFSYLYKISLIRGEKEEAEKWKKEFNKSTLPNKDYYLKNF